MTNTPQEEGMPCVSCGAPSNTSTPDDAEMCWKCFGEFNASAYDELKAENAALREAVRDLSTGIDNALSKTLEDICECVGAPMKYNKAKSGIRQRFVSAFDAWKDKHAETIEESK